MTRRVNPFRPIYDAINNRGIREKAANLPVLPRLMDIELTNACNLDCIFCDRRAMSRKVGMMPEEVFARVVEEARTGGIPLAFIRWGENMLHPMFFDYSRRVKEAGVLLHLTTNGTLLNREAVARLIEIGLDSIKVSFQGTDSESYHEMRNDDIFEEILESVRILHEVRGDGAKPFIHVSTSLTDETPEQAESFRASVLQWADSVLIGRTNLSRHELSEIRLTPEERERFLELKSRETNKCERMECPEVFDKLSINWDGTVSACCGDYDNLMVVGDIRTESLSAIWNGDKLNHIRSVLLRSEYEKFKLCSRCYKTYERMAPQTRESADATVPTSTAPPNP